MNKDEVSKEIIDFLKFNAVDIKDLMSSSPEIANAFNNVVSAIDQQYGKGLIGKSIDGVINEKIDSFKFKTLFQKGDYLIDVDIIKIPYKVFDWDEKLLVNDLINTKGFKDNLIIYSIENINSKLYYKTTYAKDINYFDEQILIEKSLFRWFFFEVEEIDKLYNDYFTKNGKTNYECGSIIMCPDLSKLIGNPFYNKVLDRYYIHKTDEDYYKVGRYYNNNNINIEIIEKIGALSFFPDNQIIFIRDIQNVNNKNYYITMLPTGSINCFEAKQFDDCFGSSCPSIKNNSVMKITHPSTDEILGFRWYDKVAFKTNSSGKIIIKFNFISFTPEYIFERNMALVDSVDDFLEIYSEKNSFYYLNYDESRIEIEKYQETNSKTQPLVIPQTTTKKPTEKIAKIPSVLEGTRPEYMLKAVFNKQGARQSPTITATIFDLGNLMIGADGNLWEITEDKNGTKRWKKKQNVFSFLPEDLFEGSTPDPLKVYNLSTLTEMQESLKEGMSYFEPNDSDYISLNDNLEAVELYIKYSPNLKYFN
jgi:hypothetical protein